jgi:hypothetical protein
MNIAQETIAKLNEYADNAAENQQYDLSERWALRANGARHLHTQLSIEARAILKEYDDLMESTDSVDLAYSWSDDRSTLYDAFERLGLIVDDEPGGCYDPHGMEASDEH